MIHHDNFIVKRSAGPSRAEAGEGKKDHSELGKHNVED